MNKELKLNELLKELSRLEEELFILQVSDDWCYSNGSAYPLHKKIANLRKEINDLRAKA